jgi:hypothetical protein
MFHVYYNAPVVNINKIEVYFYKKQQSYTRNKSFVILATSKLTNLLFILSTITHKYLKFQNINEFNFLNAKQ